MNSENSKLSLFKEQLTKELAKVDSDNTRILELSNKIANLDTSTIRFSVDAGIVNRLGKELVAKGETAVSELVKNAYDADATIVDLIFENCESDGGILTIDDDGIGMERDQLINGFMRISSPDKILNPVSEWFKRKRAGQKGIGRFATHRLGKKLTIITQTTQSQNATKVTIDWDLFEIQSNIQYIPNVISTLPKQKEHGTTLIIEGLREAWTISMIKRVYRYISELLQPFPLSKIKFTGVSEVSVPNLLEPGFKASCFKNNKNDLEIIADEQTAFFDHALAEIEGFVTEEGQGMWSVKSNKIDLLTEVYFIGKETKSDDSKFNFLRNVHFKVYYFIYDKSLIPVNFSQIRDLASQQGGVRLYRNGFRVLSYGERGNDWIGLDESIRKRAILPVHGNNNFFGFVEVTDKDGTQFEELANREGLIENLAYGELVDFVYRTIISAVLIIAESRGRKSNASQKNWKNESEERKQSVKEKIDETKETLGQIKNVLNDNKDTTNISNEVKREILTLVEGAESKIEDIKAETQKQTEQQEQLLDEIAMLRILAALGLIIGEFVHEIKHFVPELKADADNLLYFKDKYTDIGNFIERVSNNTNLLTTYTSYFDRTVSSNELRNLQHIEVRDVIRPFISTIQQDLLRSNINIDEPIFRGYDLFTLPMHKSEWASILFNFYSNAKKAVKSSQKGHLQVFAGKQDKYIYVEFSDNGIGIPEENDSRIFDAFYTTNSPIGHSADYQQEVTGTGLGLKIVRDIVESYGGNIYVKRPANEGFITTIRIEIPKK
jgi:signal transduction histidine kinase